MESEQSGRETIHVREDQRPDIDAVLVSGMKEFNARFAHYCSIRASIASTEKQRGNLSHAESSRVSPGSAVNDRPNSNSADRVPLSTRSSFAPGPQRLAPMQLVDAFLSGDSRPGSAGTGQGRVDSRGRLTLQREVSGLVLCLNVSFVDEVNSTWNIPLTVMADLGAWLNREFVATQNTRGFPNGIARAITTIDQIWEVLARFDTTAPEKASLIRATPVELGRRMAIIEASVISVNPTTEAAPARPGLAAVAKGYAANTTYQIIGSTDKNVPANGSIANDHNRIPQPDDKSLQNKNEAQQAEITTLERSVKRYSSRIRAANKQIRELEKRLRDSEDRVGQLQNQHNAATKKGEFLGGSRNAPASSLNTIPPESLQQASDLSDEVTKAAVNLVDVVDSYAIIRPGVTERALRDLQLTVDIIHETAQDIENEPIAGSRKHAGEVMEEVMEENTGDDEHEDDGGGNGGGENRAGSEERGDERYWQLKEKHNHPSGVVSSG